MFDDSYAREAWTESDQSCVIFLMDCWNPHLTEAAQAAVKLQVEASDDFENV